MAPMLALSDSTTCVGREGSHWAPAARNSLYDDVSLFQIGTKAQVFEDALSDEILAFNAGLDVGELFQQQAFGWCHVLRGYYSAAELDLQPSVDVSNLSKGDVGGRRCCLRSVSQAETKSSTRVIHNGTGRASSLH